MSGGRVAVVGIFGEIDVPLRDAYSGGQDFAFISTNFVAKGGRVVLSAFREVKRRYPAASLIVIGDKASGLEKEDGVVVTGYLRKEVPREHAQLCNILGGARALVHPTRSDISPLVLVEAGYFGCPAITSRAFAIPELIDDGRSGILLDDPSDIGAVVRAMEWMLEQGDAYLQMRRTAWAKAHGDHSKARFEERLLSFVREGALGESALRS